MLQDTHRCRTFTSNTHNKINNFHPVVYKKFLSVTSLCGGEYSLLANGVIVPFIPASTPRLNPNSTPYPTSAPSPPFNKTPTFAKSQLNFGWGSLSFFVVYFIRTCFFHSPPYHSLSFPSSLPPDLFYPLPPNSDTLPPLSTTFRPPSTTLCPLSPLASFPAPSPFFYYSEPEREYFTGNPSRFTGI